MDRQFLYRKKQQVKLCNTQSDWKYIHGGVPQDTQLGPVLFVLMINDLQTKCDSYKCVDDTCIVYTGSDSQAPNLQEAADAAYMWTIQNDMKINESKTKELVIDYYKTRTHFSTIRIDGTDTHRVTEAKILGITIINNLTWDVRSCKARNTITSILHSMRYLTGSQCSCSNAAVIFRRSPRLIRRTTLAAERCTISRRCKRSSTMPLACT